MSGTAGTLPFDRALARWATLIDEAHQRVRDSREMIRQCEDTVARQRLMLRQLMLRRTVIRCADARENAMKTRAAATRLRSESRAIRAESFTLRVLANWDRLEPLMVADARA